MRNKEAAFILLAGGKSTRMGIPKYTLLTPQGLTIIDYLHMRLAPLFEETLLVVREKVACRSTWRVVKDALPLQGPLVGIYSGLTLSNHDTNFVLACDMPFILPELVSYLLTLSTSEIDVVVPVVRGFYQPLCAVYKKSALPVIAKALQNGHLKVSGIYNELRVYEVHESDMRRFDPHLVSFTDIDTPRQLHLLSILPDVTLNKPLPKSSVGKGG